MKKILVDSNILIYAINTSSPKNAQARDFLEETAKTCNLFLAQQNILETLRVLTHPKFPNPMTVYNAAKALELLGRQAIIITPVPATYLVFQTLIKKYPHPGNFIFDTYLVATALTAGVRIIATDNERDLGIFKEIKVLNPFK